MLCKILTSNPVYPVILVHDTKTVRKSWRKIPSASGSRQAVGRKWACQKIPNMSMSER